MTKIYLTPDSLHFLFENNIYVLGADGDFFAYQEANANIVRCILERNTFAMELST